MKEAGCRGAWQGVLREATRALDAMTRTSTTTGVDPTGIVAFEAGAAAIILNHFRAGELLDLARQHLRDGMAAATRSALAAQLGIRLSLINWLTGKQVISDDLYTIANACLDDLADGPDQPEVTFVLLLRCYVELRDFSRLRLLREELSGAWQAARRGSGSIFVDAGEELLNVGELSAAWCVRGRLAIGHSIGWLDPNALAADGILQLRRIIAAAEQDVRQGYEIAVELCASMNSLR